MAQKELSTGESSYPDLLGGQCPVVASQVGSREAHGVDVTVRRDLLKLALWDRVRLNNRAIASVRGVRLRQADPSFEDFLHHLRGGSIVVG